MLADSILRDKAKEFAAVFSGKDEDFKYVAMWEYTGDPGKAVLHKEELKYEEIELQTRSYK